MTAPGLSLRLEKSLRGEGGPFTLDIALDVAEGAIVAITGPSGAGKTTLLRLIAGLERPAAGHVASAGVIWHDGKPGMVVPTKHRSIGFLFQDLALFPTMTVRGNLRFAAEGSASPEVTGDLIDELLAAVGLAGLADRRPDELSGGQRQRAALARALVRRPRLLLLDEPLSALDDRTRRGMQDLFMDVQARYRPTTLLVSHDGAEIWRLASRVVVIDKGRVVADGPPATALPGGAASDHFETTGQVIAVSKSAPLHVVTVLVGGRPVRLLASAADAMPLAPGDRIAIAARAFCPRIRKLHD